MEHLREGIASHLPRVRYISDFEYQYDYQGFQTFPDRVGWRLDCDGQWAPFGEIRNSPRNGPLGSIAAFLQAWLFFGLLAEVLGPDAQLRLEEFYEEDAHNTWWIKTDTLPRYLLEWKAKIEAGADSYARLVQAQLALDHARALVSKYCSVSDGSGPAWEIDPMIALSFLVLGETLSHAKVTIAESLQFDIPGWLSTSRPGWGYGEAVLNQMKHDNWCPRSIQILQGLLQDNATGMLYAMRLSHPKALGLDHRRCNIQNCKARDHSSYIMRNHTSNKGCTCAHLGPSLQTLTRHIWDGKVVVLEYTPHEYSIKVVPYEENMRYVVLSHVWADGFGNSEANTLPLCRLNMFVEVFERLSSANRALQAGGNLTKPQTPLYFWIDTLAIPIGNEYREERRKALLTMHETYRLATCTVVLDLGLMNQGRGSSYAETAMKIATCYWITRLWTLQEAYLSRRLLFNFADALVDLDDLENMYKVDLISPVSLVARSYHLALLGQERNRMLRDEGIARRHEEGGSLDPTFLVSLWNALQWRTTSHAQHETLALAILLRINTEPFDDAKISMSADFQQDRSRLDQKMQNLISKIENESGFAIPAEMVFLPGPKLTTRGFRWAPKTWLNDCGNVRPERLSSQRNGAQLTSEGLLFNCSGFKLHSTGKIAIDEMNEWEFPVDATLSDWIIVRDADEPSPDQTTPRGKSLAIVTKYQKRDLQIALLVAVTGLRDKIIYADILKRIYVRTEVDIGRVSELRNNFRNKTSGATFGEVLSPNQQWCLDGAEKNKPLAMQESSWYSSFATGLLGNFQIRSSITQKSQS